MGEREREREREGEREIERVGRKPVNISFSLIFHS